MIDHLDAGRETVKSKLRSRALVPDTLFGDPAHYVHQVHHSAVVEVEILETHGNRDVGGDSAFLRRRQEVVEGVPVAVDPRTRRRRGQPLLEEGQVREHLSLRALHRLREVERDVLDGPLPDILDDDARIGQVRVIFRYGDQEPAAPAMFSARMSWTMILVVLTV